MNAAEYEHDNPCLLASVGLTEERIDDIKSLCYQFLKECHTFSEICEKLESCLSTRELALLATQHVIESYEQAKAAALSRLFRDE